MHPLLGELRLLSAILQSYDQKIIPIKDYSVVALILHFINDIQFQLRMR